MEGERNTGFFHKSVLIKRKTNKILMLKDEVGQEIVDPIEIQNHICNFYNNLFQSGETEFPWPQTPMEPVHSDCREINICYTPSEEEIQRNIFRIRAFKASGPDWVSCIFLSQKLEHIKT